MEAKGDAVICVRCAGRGWVEIIVHPFVGRRKRAGIARIRFGSGLVTDASFGLPAWMSYAEFERRIPAKDAP
jgi:hypothetical protein